MRRIAFVVLLITVLAGLAVFPAAGFAQESDMEYLDISLYPELRGMTGNESAALLFLRYGNEKSEKALEGAKTVKNVSLVALDADEERNYVLLQRLLELYDVPIDDMILPIVFYSSGYVCGYEGVELGFPQIAADGPISFIPVEAVFGPQQAGMSPWAWGAVAVLGIAAGLSPMFRRRKAVSKPSQVSSKKAANKPSGKSAKNR